MSELKVNKVTPRSGTTVTLGDSGDTITIPSGATLSNLGTATGFGKVLQVVQAETSTATTVASTSYADSGLSGSITPTSASSKILVIINQVLSNNRDLNDIGGNLQLLRGATVIKNYQQCMRARATGATGVTNQSSQSFVYLDSPATTSSTTYKTQISCTSTSNAGDIVAQQFSSVSMITLIEIAG